ncbi:MAG: polysaccharide deacetylase family protein [Anaerolineae bacterium]|nr:polysaccharide deacetylase family protein [Gemmatimonadaceae bacterium]
MKAILTYHSIDDSGSPISVSPEAFRSHVAWFASGVTRVVSVGQLLALPDDADAIAITFDDGFRNFGVVAAPLLVEHGLPATLFVVTDAVGGTNSWGGIPHTGIPTLALLDWKEVASLAAAGIELGSHTRTHAHLPRLSAAAVADELMGSAERIKMETDLVPAGFAYPYGEVSDAASIRAESVYKWACTTSMRGVGPGDRAWLLPRIDMYYFRESGRLDSWGSARFKQYLWLRSRARQVRRGLTAVNEYL